MRRMSIRGEEREWEEWVLEEKKGNEKNEYKRRRTGMRRMSIRGEEREWEELV